METAGFVRHYFFRGGVVITDHVRHAGDPPDFRAADRLAAPGDLSVDLREEHAEGIKKGRAGMVV